MQHRCSPNSAKLVEMDMSIFVFPYVLAVLSWDPGQAYFEYFKPITMSPNLVVYELLTHGNWLYTARSGYQNES